MTTTYSVYRNGGLLVAGLTSPSYVDTAVTNNVTYGYQVSATINGVEGPKSATVSCQPSATLPTPVVKPFAPSMSQSAFVTALSDQTIDVIELAAGSYPWDNVLIDVDRTARPLTIRPIAGATCTFPGNGATTAGIFFVGLNAATKYITFDGSTGTMLFSGISLSQCGVFEIRSSDHCTFKYLNFAGLKRDAAYSNQPYKSWAAYISYAGSRPNTNLTLDHWTLGAPAVSRDVSAIQVASSALTNTNISISNMSMVNYDYAFYCEVPTTGIVLDTWTLTNCGNAPTPASVDFTGAVNISGSYSNIVATSSSPYRDTHSGGGTISNGGGNSGI